MSGIPFPIHTSAVGDGRHVRATDAADRAMAQRHFQQWAWLAEILWRNMAMVKINGHTLW